MVNTEHLIVEKANKIMKRSRMAKVPSCLKSVKATCHDYADATTTHGCSYACNVSLPRIDRLVWTAWCLLMCVCALNLVWGSYLEWYKAPVVTSLNSAGTD